MLWPQHDSPNFPVFPYPYLNSPYIFLDFRNENRFRTASKTFETALKTLKTTM